MTNFISVLICTYNRADLVTRLLQSFCQQTVSSQDYEIIVVDNHSKDHTEAVVTRFQSALPNLRYCFEAQQGLSHARNRGLSEAKGDYVGYIDDDAIAPPDWVEVAQDLITSLDLAMFGGPYYPFYDSSKPVWWKNQYRSLEQAKEARPLTRPLEYLSGNNMFFRREVLYQIGGFDPNYGMSGDKVATCEEREILLRIRKAMPQALIYYDPRLYIHHLVMADKMTFTWLVPHRFNSGRSHGRMYRAHQLSSIRFLVKQTCITPLLLLSHLLFTVWWRDRTHYPYRQNYWFEKLLPLVRTLGLLYEQWQWLFKQPNVLGDQSAKGLKNT